MFFGPFRNRHGWLRRHAILPRVFGLDRLWLMFSSVTSTGENECCTPGRMMFGWQNGMHTHSGTASPTNLWKLFGLERLWPLRFHLPLRGSCIEEASLERMNPPFPSRGRYGLSRCQSGTASGIEGSKKTGMAMECNLRSSIWKV